MASDPLYDRAPAVAGTFYPSAARLLDEQVTGFLRRASETPLDGELMGLVSPHAGYLYSGAVAASAFWPLRGRRYETVVLLGPSHHRRFPGAALHAKGTFRTPLGAVPVDEEFCARLIALDESIRDLPEPHVPEHGLEVQLPFLQKTLPSFSIVPILLYDFSDANCRRLADALTRAVEGRNALIVTTTDLAHYPAYQDAVASDTAMIEAIESFEPSVVRERNDAFLSKRIRNLHVTMCGLGPVITGMTVAAQSGATGFQTFRYANSGDVAGTPKSQVVGYVGGAFVARTDSWKDAPTTGAHRRERIDVAMKPDNGLLNAETQRAILILARDAIRRHVNDNPIPALEAYGFPEAVNETLRTTTRGAFVTIEGGGALRGCIGQIVALEPLAELIPRMAVAAATEDRRFPPVEPDEIDLLDLEASVLTEPKVVSDFGEIEVGRHGLIVRKGVRSGLLLPQVAAERGWTTRQFLAYTCMKAGLQPTAFEDPGVVVESFEAQVFSEAEHELK